MEQPTFLKTQDNRIINERHIRWVKKVEECFEVCMKSNGCKGGLGGFMDIHRVCKKNHPSSYDKLIHYFESS